MDQLKVILKHLQKYHFWLLCVAAMLAGFLGWIKARKDLSAAYDQKKGTIVGKFSSLDGIRSNEFPPNRQWKDGIAKLTEDEKTKVASAWETVYNDQKKLLEWPKVLGEGFLKFVDTSPPNAPIPSQLCALYQNRINAEIPRLLAIADAAPSEPDHEPKVMWAAASQKELQALLEWSKAPSSMQVRLAQEDLWVYSALLQIIKAVNDAAEFTPYIKEISVLEIGKSGADAFKDGMAHGHIDVLATANPATTAVTTQTAPLPPVEGPGAPAKPLDEGRYVDANGERLAGGMAATQPFKRMPIHMKLSMDQREITRLLVSCANSTLPVEIRQLRIGSTKQSGGRTSRGGPVATTGQGGGSHAASDEAGDSYDVPVELNGIIYIYNPPPTTAPAGPPAEPVQQ
jgi:hypothetical protein